MVQIPVDAIEEENSRMHKKKETRIYYRPATDDQGNPIWMPTLPLPADPWHLNYYTQKGFKLWPPGQEPGQEEVSALQEQVKELEERAESIKAETTENEEVKASLEGEVKVLEEQASTLKEAMGEVKLDTSEGRISCPLPDCSVTVKSYIGLSRHMSKVHGKK